MIVAADGWRRYNTWEHSASLRELYTARARDEVEEMTCAAQAAELLAPLVRPGDTVLDIGCGTGWFFHSLRRRAIDVEYWGIDATDAFVEIGRRELARFGLPPERLQVIRLDDLRADVDHVVCMNVLSNIDGIHKPLERLLDAAGRSLILRESLGNGATTSWVRDEYLDDVDLGVHVNRYDVSEVLELIRARGFEATSVVDRRSGGEPELVIGHPHHWAFVVAERLTARETA